jgi:hypothetical protein
LTPPPALTHPRKPILLVVPGGEHAIRNQETATVQAKERSRSEALAEEIRDLLLQAAYVEIARASADGLFSADGPLGFSVETVYRLRRHKVPFAGALKVVFVDGVNTSY